MFNIWQPEQVQCNICKHVTRAELFAAILAFFYKIGNPNNFIEGFPSPVPYTEIIENIVPTVAQFIVFRRLVVQHLQGGLWGEI